MVSSSLQTNYTVNVAQAFHALYEVRGHQFTSAKCRISTAVETVGIRLNTKFPRAKNQFDVVP